MIQVYSPGNANFDKNGDAVIHPQEAQVMCELNGTWSATMTHPLDEEGRWKALVENCTVKMPSYNGDQLFRVNRVEKTDVVSCEMTPVFLNSADDCFLVNKRPTNKTGQQALDILMEGTVYSGISDIATVSTAYYEYKNLIEALTGEENSFLSRWGGEMEFDNFTVRIMNRIGSDNGLEIRYGKDINGLTYTVDMSEVVTRIYPKAYNGYKMTGTPYVDSPLIIQYPNIKNGTITFDHIRMAVDVTEGSDPDPGLIICQTQEELNAALAQACLDEFAAGIDKPIVTAEIQDLVDLSKVEGYEDLSRPIHLGDTVYLRHSLLGIVSTSRVMALTYDAVSDCVRSITAGAVPYSFMDAISSTVNRVADSIRDDGTVRAESVRGIMDMKKTALFAQYDASEKQDVLGILFENNDQTSPLYGAMALGTQGFMIADAKKLDGSWNWQTFGTARGFDASMLITGILASRNGDSYWDLDNSDFRFYDAENDTTIQLDKGVIDFYSGMTKIASIMRAILEVEGVSEEIVGLINSASSAHVSVGNMKAWLRATSESMIYAAEHFIREQCGDSVISMMSDYGSNLLTYIMLLSGNAYLNINGKDGKIIIAPDRTNLNPYINLSRPDEQIDLICTKMTMNGNQCFSGTITVGGLSIVIKNGLITSVS